MLYPVVSIT